MNNDLISREALKDTIIKPLNVNDAGKDDWYEGYYTAKNEDVYYIDNAPTVEVTDYDTGYQDGLEAGLNDIRTKGEWQKDEGKDERDNFYTCSVCGRSINVICGETLNDYPFCHCGADMRKGDTE